MSDDGRNIFDHPDLRDNEWAGRVRREMRRNRWRRHRTWVLILVVLSLVIAGIVAYNALRPTGSTSASPPQVPVATTPPSTTTQPATTPTSKVDLKAPFANTPAAGWADGEAGLVVTPSAVDGFSPAKVAKALDQARAAVVMGHLDRRVIQDGNVDLLTALFAPDAQQEVRDDNGQFRIRVKPGFKLLDVPPKVTGTLTVSAGDKKGQLRVHASFAIAYAFDKDLPQLLRDPMDIVAVTRYDKQYVFLDDSFVKAAQGLWMGDSDSYWYSVGCKASKEHLLAPAYSEVVMDIGGAAPSASAVFDPNTPMPTTGTCPS